MTKQFAAFTLMLGMLLPMVGNAQGVYRDNNRDAIGGTKVYLGVKYGVMRAEPDISGSDDFEMDNIGIVFGGHINDWLAIELDYNQTVSADKQDFQGSDIKYKTDALGLFLVFKTTGDFYARAKVGYVILDQDVTTIGSDNVYGMAGGLGGGYYFNDNIALELEYTLYPETDEFDRLGKIIDDTWTNDFISIGLIFSYN